MSYVSNQRTAHIVERIRRFRLPFRPEHTSRQSWSALGASRISVWHVILRRRCAARHAQPRPHPKVRARTKEAPADIHAAQEHHKRTLHELRV